MNWDNFFASGFFFGAFVVLAFFLVMPVVIYFLIMSAIANRVNTPKAKHEVLSHRFPIVPLSPSSTDKHSDGRKR